MKPILRPSRSQDCMKFAHILAAMASVICMLWCICLPPVHAYLHELSRQHGAQQASIGICFIILEILTSIGQSLPASAWMPAYLWLSVFMALPRSLLSDSFKHRIYHRTHISHMRIDRMRSLIRQHGIPPPIFSFLRFDILGLWLSTTSVTPSSLALSKV